MAFRTLHGNGTSDRGMLNPTMAQMFARHPVYDSIFCRLSPASFARMSRTCRDVREATLDFATRAYDLNRRLGHYFNNTPSFRELMAKTHLLISGSFALQFFDRTFYPGSDFDLYVHLDDDVIEVGRWLKTEGYAYMPSGRQASTLDAEFEALNKEDALLQRYGQGLAVAGVFSFEKQVEGVPGEDTIRKVQIVVPSRNHLSPLETIIRFHSSMRSALLSSGCSTH